jgi:hypothetical protein
MEFKKPKTVQKKNRNSENSKKNELGKKKKGSSHTTDDESIMLDDVFPTQDPMEAGDGDWIRVEGEKLPVESVGDSSFDPFQTDKINATEMMNVRLFDRYGIKHFSLWRFAFQHEFMHATDFQ